MLVFFEVPIPESAIHGNGIIAILLLSSPAVGQVLMGFGGSVIAYKYMIFRKTENSIRALKK